MWSTKKIFSILGLIAACYGANVYGAVATQAAAPGDILKKAQAKLQEITALRATEIPVLKNIYAIENDVTKKITELNRLIGQLKTGSTERKNITELVSAAFKDYEAKLKALKATTK
ncbi:MAG: hypothetical protein WCW33_03660 [Candidatus Babeliales bacterium]|jgi:multidrug efflux pump subunit AcrA (membrane-fusion protein)